MLWAGTSSPVLGFGTKEQGPREGSIVIPGKENKGPGRKEAAWSSSVISERKGTPFKVFCHNYISCWHFCQALMNDP